MRKWVHLLCFLLLSVYMYSQNSDREYWVDLAYKISEPVLRNMSEGKLHENMKLELSPTWDGRNKEVGYMEAFGRLVAGITPWLSLPDDNTSEGEKRKQLKLWLLKSYKNAVDPNSPDYLYWKGENQILVDASYIAESFLRAPESFWYPLDEVTKQRYIEHFKSLRNIRPAYNNWLLFRGMTEAFLASIDADPDVFALFVITHKMNEWYLGDGWYSDGREFSMDYYQSYVIHPMLVEVLEVMEKKKMVTPMSSDLALRRMQRYNTLLERMISPEATYPIVGRSMTYRMGAFQTLALSSWKYGLPEEMTKGQIRNALTSVMKNLFSASDIFNSDGFLQLGFKGHQPELADYYSNNGSMYITSLVFLPLGLPADDSFWTDNPEPWTSKKAWSGMKIRKDYHQSIKN